MKLGAIFASSSAALGTTIAGVLGGLAVLGNVLILDRPDASAPVPFVPLAEAMRAAEAEAAADAAAEAAAEADATAPATAAAPPSDPSAETVTAGAEAASADAADAPPETAIAATADTDAAAPETPLDLAAAAPGAAAPEAAPATAPQDVGVAVPPAAPAPAFDQIRVAPDGSTVVAGRAPDDAEVVLRLDGDEVAVTRPVAGGSFATLFAIPPAEAPRILTLAARMPDGSEIAGPESVLVAPFAGPAAPPAPGAAPVSPDTPAPPGAVAVEVAPGAAPDTADAATAEVATTRIPAAEAAHGAAAAPAAPARPADALAAATPGATAPEAAPAEAPGLAIAAIAGTEGAETPLPAATAAAPTAPAPDTGTDTGTDTGPAIAAAPEAPEPPAAPASPALVVAGPDGLRVLPDPAAPPLAQTEVALDAISYDSAGGVILSGRGRAMAQVEITLDARPVQMAAVGPSGDWTIDLPGVAPGIYTLAVRQLDEAGAPEDAVETPFLREDPERIVASPMAVARGASVITVQPGFTLWGIAEANFGDGIAYVQIFEANRDRIRDPDWIYPGQIFRLPARPDPSPETAADTAAPADGG